MEAVRKITIQIPERLLRKAQGATGAGITQTIRQGLKLVTAGRIHDELRRLRGKVRFSIDPKSLREDR